MTTAKGLRGNANCSKASELVWNKRVRLSRKLQLPATADIIQNLNDSQVEALDQYIYRFTKWQDAMGERLFKQSLQLLAEDTRSMAFIDKLNRLEQLGALRSVTEWLEMRQLQNALAHEYGDSPQELADGINTVYGKFTDVKQILNQFKTYITSYL